MLARRDLHGRNASVSVSLAARSPGRAGRAARRSPSRPRRLPLSDGGVRRQDGLKERTPVDWQMAANRSRIVARLSGSALAVLKLACARWWATRQALQGRAAVRARGRGSTSAGPNASCDESARRVGGRRCRGRDSRRRGAGTAPRTPPAIRRAGRRARPSPRGTTQPNFGQPNPTSDNPTQPQPNPTRNNPTQSTILLSGPHAVVS